MQSTPLFFLNNLKSFIILLVVTHHVVSAYALGETWSVIDPQRSHLFIPILSVNASFFMSILFFISAYFVPSSFRSHQAKDYIKKKLLRLGLPALFITFLIVPFDVWIAKGFDFGYHPSSGHAWFLYQLLLFSLTYCFFDRFIEKLPNTKISHIGVLAFTLFLAITSYGVGTWFPQNSWLFFSHNRALPFLALLFFFYIRHLGQKVWMVK